MAEKTDYFINATKLVDVHSSTNIPTVLFYRSSGSPLFGSNARETAASNQLLNEDFKVDLGNSKPGTTGSKKYRCADGRSRSAAELTSDFIHGVVGAANAYLAQNECSVHPSVVVAEPLAMQEGIVSDAWLANYRNYLRRILSGKGFKAVEFLPEPFAVYQYYRHSERHPLLSGNRKHNALVIDFGGGTFDVCLIETTKDGDISEGGRMARPLSASSIPIGGFFINRTIAEELIRKVLASKNIPAVLNKGFDMYRRWRREDVDLATLAPNHQNFINNYDRLVYRVEDLKLALCRMIRDWSLEVTSSLSVPAAVPADPFSPDSPMVNVQFSAAELRRVFETKIWDKNLKSAIHLSLQRGKAELNGAPITIVLLSGGSANIRWLSHLLKRDFGAELQDAEILQLKDFQEVVAKGLAVECARRSYTPDRSGDFAATTYNRLCCILDPDEAGMELKRFVPKDDALPPVDIPGVLLPSASFLRSFENKSMRWKVHLDHAPRTSLSYYFLRSSFDPNDIQNLQNMEERTVFSPKDIRLDSNLILDLTVAKDGTAEPTFIYKQGRTPGETVSRKGRSFYLDMVTAEDAPPASAYLGLDFGTSNTSVSFIDDSSIQIYTKRSTEKFWSELSQLSGLLPYPLASSLAFYLCQTDQAKLANAARDFLEAGLTLAAYIAYVDHCLVMGRSQTRLLRGFTQRSAGPLWRLFQDSMQQSAGKRQFSEGFALLLDPQYRAEIDRAVDIAADYKHGKIHENGANVSRAVTILANVTHSVFQEATLGYFELVQKQRFSKRYEGSFRHAHGRQPFIDVSRYDGTIAFSNNETYLVNAGKKSGVTLEPLILWADCPDHADHLQHCFLYDIKERDGSFIYKATGFPCCLRVAADGPLAELASQMLALLDGDKAWYASEVVLARQ